jgi:hypothetical protein
MQVWLDLESGLAPLTPTRLMRIPTLVLPTATILLIVPTRTLTARMSIHTLASMAGIGAAGAIGPTIVAIIPTGTDTVATTATTDIVAAMVTDIEAVTPTGTVARMHLAANTASAMGVPVPSPVAPVDFVVGIWVASLVATAADTAELALAA